MSSYIQKAKDLLKQGHEQNVADINTNYAEGVKNLIKNVSATVARNGMRQRSLRVVGDASRIIGAWYGFGIEG